MKNEGRAAAAAAALAGNSIMTQMCQKHYYKGVGGTHSKKPTEGRVSKSMLKENSTNNEKGRI